MSEQTQGRARPTAAERERRRRAGWNQYDLGSFNEATILETIRQAGSISRVEVAEQTGLTQQSVSRILRLLLERGLLAEQASERAQRLGKPRTPVTLRGAAAHAIGVLVDPELVSVVLIDLHGEVLGQRSRRLQQKLRPPQLVETIAVAVEALQANHHVDNFLGVGVAVPGPISTNGELLDLPLQAVWRNVPLQSLLAERLECPVVIEKDGTAAATGERWLGRTERAEDFVYLYLGTGVGSGLMINGEAYQGISSNAGEFGQLCAISNGRLDDHGRPELVRECNPTVALPQIAQEQGYAGPLSYRDVCAAVGAGDPTATAAAQQIADVIARGTVALIDLLDLPVVVVGGPQFEPELQDIMINTIDAAVNTWPTAHRARHVRVEPSVLKTQAAAIGVASTIFHQAFTATDRKRFSRSPVRR